MSLTVREYETADGEIAFRQWLATFDRSVRPESRRGFFASRPETSGTTRAWEPAFSRLAS